MTLTIGICQAIGLLLITLQLLGVIHWSWWIILGVLFLDLILLVGFVLIMFIISCLIKLWGSR